jgi:CheY-like chemotaxis protein
VSEPAARTILAVDDSATVLARVREALEARGYEVVTSGDWVEANRLVHKVRPSLVLVDEHLGAFHGTFLVRAFRGFFGADLPIVVMSSEDVAAEARAAGATTFIPKAHLTKVGQLVDGILACPDGARCKLTANAYGVACTCPRPSPSRRLPRRQV